MLRWGAENSIDLQFIDPGKPVQNAHIESFNGRAHDEFLNLHSFLTLNQAREAPPIQWVGMQPLTQSGPAATRGPLDLVMGTDHRITL